MPDVRAEGRVSAPRTLLFVSRLSLVAGVETLVEAHRIMNRREVFKLLGVTIAGAAGRVAPGRVAPVPVAPSWTYGRLTVGTHCAHREVTGEYLHVWVNGEDVTDGCYEADDVEGYALVYCRGGRDHADHVPRGARHIDGDGRACRMRLTGAVVIAPGAPLR
jgi:hypothetical protein